MQPKTRKRRCLDCKNQGCIGQCRYSKATGERTPIATGSAPRETKAPPRLYRNPVEPLHWLAWTDLGWFRFPAKLNGWNERRRAGDISCQILQRVPLRLAFNTGLIEAFECHIPNRAA